MMIFELWLFGILMTVVMFMYLSDKRLMADGWGEYIGMFIMTVVAWPYVLMVVSKLQSLEIDQDFARDERLQVLMQKAVNNMPRRHDR